LAEGVSSLDNTGGWGPPPLLVSSLDYTGVGALSPSWFLPLTTPVGGPQPFLVSSLDYTGVGALRPSWFPPLTTPVGRGP